MLITSGLLLQGPGNYAHLHTSQWQVAGCGLVALRYTTRPMQSDLEQRKKDMCGPIYLGQLTYGRQEFQNDSWEIWQLTLGLFVKVQLFLG